jgi:hypothetical protein
MLFKLVVASEFHGYPKGTVVTNQDEVARLLIEHEAHVVKAALTDDELAEIQAAEVPPPPSKPAS